MSCSPEIPQERMNPPMEKKLFVNKEQLEEIVKQYPTPFHLYDEKGHPRPRPRSQSGVCVESRFPRVFCRESDSESLYPQKFCRRKGAVLTVLPSRS